MAHGTSLQGAPSAARSLYDTLFWCLHVLHTRYGIC